MASLSAQPSNGNSANEGAMCSGAGSGERFHRAAPSIRRRKKQSIEETNFFSRAYPPVKIFKVRATSQRDVLAIVHMLAAREHVRRGTATQMGPLFEQTYAEAGFSQRDGRGKSRQAAADHDHALRGHCVGSTSPAARAAGFPVFFGSAQPHALGENIIAALFDPPQQLL